MESFILIAPIPVTHCHPPNDLTSGDVKPVPDLATPPTSVTGNQLSDDGVEPDKKPELLKIKFEDNRNSGTPSDLDPSNDPQSELALEQDTEEENYGMAKIRSVMDTCQDNPDVKPSLSYIGLISLAIGSTDSKRMLLSEIYAWIAEKFPYYQSRDRSWRNSIRHNLSLNECFIKAGRSENGKGNYWTIHHANVTDFTSGDFRRRRARRRVRKCNEELERLQLGYSTNDTNNFDPYFTAGCNGYVMMTSTQAPAHALIRLFGADIILSKEERHQGGFVPDCDVTQASYNELCVPSATVVTPSCSEYSTVAQNAYYTQNNTSGYALTQYPTPEVDNRFTALVSAAESYRNMEQTTNGCQFVSNLKGLPTSAVRYAPY